MQLLQTCVSLRAGAGQGLNAEREQLGVADEARSHPESEVTQVNSHCRPLEEPVGDEAFSDDSIILAFVGETKEESSGEEVLRAVDRSVPEATANLAGLLPLIHVHFESDVVAEGLHEPGRVELSVLDKL